MADRNDLARQLAQDVHDAELKVQRAMSGSVDPKKLQSARVELANAEQKASSWSDQRCYGFGTRGAGGGVGNNGGGQ
jgi:hypothetical protein